MYTQLAKLDFTGKTIMPFTTHEGSGLGSVVSDLKKTCKGAEVKNGLAVVGSKVNGAKNNVEKWIKENL